MKTTHPEVAIAAGMAFVAEVAAADDKRPLWWVEKHFLDTDDGTVDVWIARRRTGQLRLFATERAALEFLWERRHDR